MSRNQSPVNARKNDDATSELSLSSDDIIQKIDSDQGTPLALELSASTVDFAKIMAIHVPQRKLKKDIKKWLIRNERINDENTLSENLDVTSLDLSNMQLDADTARNDRSARDTPARLFSTAVDFAAVNASTSSFDPSASTAAAFAFFSPPRNSPTELEKESGPSAAAEDSDSPNKRIVNTPVFRDTGDSSGQPNASESPDEGLFVPGQL